MAKWCLLVNGTLLLVVGIAALLWIVLIPPDPPRWGEGQVDESVGLHVGAAMALVLFVLPGLGLLAQVSGVGRAEARAFGSARRLNWAAAVAFILVVVAFLAVQGGYVGQVVPYRERQLAWRALPVYAGVAVVEVGFAVAVARGTRRRD